MLTVTQTLKRHHFITVTFGVVVLGVFVGAGLAGPGRKNQSVNGPRQYLPRITNKTSAIRIMGIESQSAGNSLVISLGLQNVSTKHIKAYAISSGKRWTTKNYFLSDESIAPNEVSKHIMPVNDSARENGLSIAAVLFEDGTSDGDPVFVVRLTETYAGMRDQATLLLPCLRKLSATLTTDCEGDATRLPLKGRSSDYDDGLRSAQEEFLTQIRDLKEKIHGKNVVDAGIIRDKVLRIALKLAQASL